MKETGTGCFLLVLALTHCFIGTVNTQQNALHTDTNPSGAQQKLDPLRLDFVLLERLLVQATNQERSKRNLDTLTTWLELQKVARNHSREMASLDFFSHESPLTDHHTLADRLKQTEILDGNIIMGENLGFDYLLHIAGIPHYVKMEGDKQIIINGRTNKPVEFQTYRDFAARMVANWLASPGHRDILLHPRYTQIGIGAALGRQNGFDVLFVTQNFVGPL